MTSNDGSLERVEEPSISRYLMRVRVGGAVTQHVDHVKINVVITPVQPSVKVAGIMKLLDDA